MKMTPADIRAHPAMAEYVKNQFHKLVHNPTIVRCLNQCGHLTLVQIRDALVWGALPQIRIVDMVRISCRPGDAGPGLYGCTRNTSDIEVARRVVDAFEAHAAQTLSGDKTQNNLNHAGRPVYVLGATLLHEMCHWGNNVNGQSEAEEMGLKFEVMAYGKTIW